MNAVRKMIAVLSGYVPNWIKERIVGSQGHPSVMANVVHNTPKPTPENRFHASHVRDSRRLSNEK